jgi:site-specific recombinase XerD
MSGSGGSGVGGRLAVHVESFRATLVERGYCERSAGRHVELLRHLGTWLQGEGLSTRELTAERVAEFLDERRRVGRRGVVTPFGMAPLLEYLDGLGIIAPQSHSKSGGVLDRYCDYLRSERGLVPQGVARYECVARLFVESVAVAGAVGWSLLSAGDVTRFLLEQCRGRGGSSARNLAAALRSFLRFAQLDGLTAVGLAAAIPPVAGWRGRSLPVGLAPGQAQQLLDSCDRDRATGRRDLAILTVLLRLGLRAGEVARMRLEDINWRAGEIVVHGKNRRHERLPLPGDVGAAVAEYLHQDRPPTPSRAVFLRMISPRQQLTPTAVTAIVYAACDRAGVPRVGAHCLRHTAASQMLRAGASLDEVGQALRQRQLKTTAIYAKVDHGRLGSLARPWPGGAA